ncbi:MAG TPA: gamma-glutamyltransferase [Gemmatimonadaceae bacterium]|nr:gamma-glutamyltransferase [Gemmatimonadaceae bacterium]
MTATFRTMRPALRRAIRAAGALAATSVASAPLPAQSMLRPDVIGREAAVVSDHALASAAGAAVLRRGGNAVDAAITMAGVLAVARPHMNGVGGDAFLLIREARTGRVYALNGSGRAGTRATPAFFAQRNLRTIPGSGILSVSVPGAVRAWEDALARFGTITLAEALGPAIDYADRGLPVSTRLALDIAGEQRKVAGDSALAQVFLVNGNAPEPGTLLLQRDLAGSLRAIAAGGADVLYTGALAQRIAEFMQREDGLVGSEDLGRHRSTWQEPISTTYLGRTVLAFPPNTQGATFLQMLNIAEAVDLTGMERNSAAYIHALAEASKLAYADRDRYLADPAFASVPLDRLLSKEYARELAQRIRRDTVIASEGSVEVRDGNGDTIFLAVVDKDGNAVSLIQSLFASFGSGRMVPGTGIVLHNRGALFTLEAGHPNVVAPGKRPFHTLSPAMALNADRSLAAVFGTPGGDGQPQTLVQILNNVLRFGMTPQQAVEAARWRVFGRARLGVEPGVDEPARGELARRGHRVTVQEPSADFGGAQMIVIHSSGARMSGADPRREAYAIAW